MRNEGRQATDKVQGATAVPTDQPPAAAENGRPPVATAGSASGSVPASMQAAAAWSWRILVIGLAVAAVVVALGAGKVLWVPVVVALLLTVLLTPFVRLMERRLRLSRGAASGIAVLSLLAVVSGLATVAGRQIVQGVGELWTKASAGLDELVVTLASSPLGLDSADIERYIDQGREQLSANSQSIVSGALSFTTTIAHVAAGTLVALFCLLFFLKDGALIWAWLVRLLPRSARMPVYEASRRGVVTLASFTRTQILVALIDAIGIGAGALILGIPLAVPLAVLVFLASFIPFVGAISTGIIAVLVTLVDQGAGRALIMLGIVLLVQQIESHLLQPLLLGHAVSLHPVAVLLSVAAGSLTAGIVGALLAVPFVATLNTVVLYLHGRDKFPELGTNPDGLNRRLRILDGPGVPDGPDGPSAPDGRTRSGSTADRA